MSILDSPELKGKLEVWFNVHVFDRIVAIVHSDYWAAGKVVDLPTFGSIILYELDLEYSAALYMSWLLCSTYGLQVMIVHLVLMMSLSV